MANRSFFLGGVLTSGKIKKYVACLAVPVALYSCSKGITKDELNTELKAAIEGEEGPLKPILTAANESKAAADGAKTAAEGAMTKADAAAKAVAAAAANNGLSQGDIQSIANAVAPKVNNSNSTAKVDLSHLANEFGGLNVFKKDMTAQEVIIALDEAKTRYQQVAQSSGTPTFDLAEDAYKFDGLAQDLFKANMSPTDVKDALNTVKTAYDRLKQNSPTPPIKLTIGSNEEEFDDVGKIQGAIDNLKVENQKLETAKQVLEDANKKLKTEKQGLETAKTDISKQKTAFLEAAKGAKPWGDNHSTIGDVYDALGEYFVAAATNGKNRDEVKDIFAKNDNNHGVLFQKGTTDKLIDSIAGSDGADFSSFGFNKDNFKSVSNQDLKTAIDNETKAERFLGVAIADEARIENVKRTTEGKDNSKVEKVFTRELLFALAVYRGDPESLFSDDKFEDGKLKKGNFKYKGYDLEGMGAKEFVERIFSYILNGQDIVTPS